MRWWLAAGLTLLLGACADEDLSQACRAHADCSAGYVCDRSAGRCIVAQPCGDDGACCPGQTCFGGSCRLLETCTDAGACSGDRSVCQRGVCVAPPCAAASDCAAADMRCLAGRCIRGAPCGGCPAGRACEPATGTCVAACGNHPCGDGAVPVVSGGEEIIADACVAARLACDCLQLPPLAPPQIGTWLGAGPAGERDFVVVGRDARYGDLVATWTTPEGTVLDRTILDGLPADGPLAGDPTGYRGGVEAPGPDVGAWAASVVVRGGVSGDTVVAIARDSTSDHLRVARAVRGAPPTAQDLDALPGAGYGASLAAAPSGALHAAWFALDGAGARQLRYGWAPAGAAASSAWTIRVIEVNPPPGPGCAEPCGPLAACVQVAGAATCAIPDVTGACEPACDRAALCVLGSCRPHVEPGTGLRPWVDAPGDQSALIPWGDGALIAHYRPDHGDLRLHQVTSASAAVTIRLDGGDGADIGRGVAMAMGAGGQVGLAYQDASRGRLLVRTGLDPAALDVADLGPGGKGIAIAVLDDGRIALAHGALDGGHAFMVIGRPGDWAVPVALSGGHMGRFNALVARDDTVVVVTSQDTLDAQLRPAPDYRLAISVLP